MDKKKMDKKKYNKKRAITYLLQLLVFVLVIGSLTITGLIITARPSYSESEKRELSKFPKFSIETFFNGEYFRGIGDWYSDTYPFREKLVGLNSKIKSIYGISSEEVHGNVDVGDDIPDEYVEPLTDNSIEENTTEDNSYIVENGDTQSLGAVFVLNNTGYEYYNFSADVANKYISLMNKQADDLKGIANVYNMIVPTSIAISLPDNYINSINSSDQKKAINYFNSGLNDNVNKVPIFDSLMSHRKEYIYYNTDHHWTSLGAYYAYEQFAKISQKECIPLSQYTEKRFDGFLGSFYNDTGKLPALEKNPDTVVTYAPNKNATMYYLDKKGTKISWPIVNDVTKYPQSLKYSTFIGGDNPYTEIENPDIKDGSSIVVIKESFGNAFVPFLVENYNKIYVIDYRYYNGSVSGLVKDKNIDDVLYINNVSALRNKYLVSKISSTL